MDFLTLVGDLESSIPQKIPKMTDGNREDFIFDGVENELVYCFF